MKFNFILTIIVFFITITVKCQYLDLEYKLEEGKEFKSVLLYNSTLNYIYDNIEYEESIYNKHEILYKVKEFRGPNYLINMQFTSLNYESIINGVKISISSEDETIPESRILKMITAEEFEIIMDKKGNIISTSGMNQIYKNLIDSIITDKKEQCEIYDFVVEAYGDSVFRNCLEMSMHIYPDKRIKPEEKWMIKSRNSRYFHTDFECDYRINSMGSDFYVIKGNSPLSINSNLKLFKNVTTDYDFTGHMKSYNYIDKKTGWIMTSNQHYFIDGIVKIYNNDSNEEETIPLNEKLYLTNTVIN